MKRLFVLSLLLLAFPAAFAQESTLAKLYVVRLQRTTPYESVCALVRADGSYRLEETHQKRVFEGLLLSDALATLRKALNDPAMVSLSQAQIEMPNIEAASFDHMQVTIARDNGWQDLRFRSPDRKPAKDQVEALQDFLGDLRKVPKARLADSDANDCIPPPAVIKRPVTVAAGVPAIQRPAMSWVVWLRQNHTTDDLNSFSMRAERKCILVTEDGTFRYEKTSQVSGSKIEGKAYQGKLPDESVQRLQAILADPQLVNAQNGEQPDALTYQGDMDGLDVDVPRSEGHQILRTRVVTGVSTKNNRQLGAGGFVHRNYAFGPIKQLKPLESWFHSAEKLKMQQIKGAVLNDCKSVTVGP
ncbi:MAG TPA: hypothetical protein VLA96_10875 [Terriglobales bacterium]|nr:hypothetical protein [Terriglobales bacterium]